ncbi:MAG: hemerythrin domain-containing protein [Comamonadaceae bacterium]|nr:MAG: hemerythrin domain-containing protein [Comamonadaceae bacterium]
MTGTRRPRGALQIIRDEHAALSAVLRAMLQMLQRGPGDAPERFFDVLRAMLFYIDEFPEKRHHPKESDLLFPKLARRAPQTMEVIHALELEHMGGHARVRDLQHLLLCWELLGDAHRQEFSDEAARYVAFYINHMKVEETQLLPVAQQCLTADDFAELDAAFGENVDPLARDARDARYDRLFTRIVHHAPAPIGLGPA